MPALTQLATSTMYVWQQVEKTDLSGNPLNPTSDTVQMAFVPVPSFGPPPDPASGQLNPAIWGTSTSGSVTLYFAGCLVGPANGGVVLTAGEYIIGVKVIDSPEVPVLWGWQLIVS